MNCEILVDECPIVGLDVSEDDALAAVPEDIRSSLTVWFDGGGWLKLSFLNRHEIKLFAEEIIEACCAAQA